MCTLLCLPLDLLVEVFAQVGPVTLLRLATTTRKFRDSESRTIEAATLMLGHLLKKDIRSLVDRFSKVIKSTCVHSKTSSPQQLFWLIKNLWRIEVRVQVEDEVLTLCFRVLALFKGEISRIATKGICVLLSDDRGRKLTKGEWLWLKRGLWRGEESERVDAIRAMLSALGGKVMSDELVVMRNESMGWLVRMLDGGPTEKRWAIGLIWLLADWSKNQRKELAGAGVVGAVGRMLVNGVSCEVLPAMFLQALQVLLTLSLRDATANSVVVAAICHEIESGRETLLETELCAWLGRLLREKAVYLQRGLHQRALEQLLYRLQEGGADTPPVVLASIIAGLGTAAATPALTAVVVRRLSHMLVTSHCTQLQTRACRGLSAIARNASAILDQPHPSYENAFLFAPLPVVNALLPTLTFLLQTGTHSDIVHAADAIGCIAQSSLHASHVGDGKGTLAALVNVLDTAHPSAKQSALMALSNLATVPRHAHRMVALGALQPAVDILSTSLDESGGEFATSFLAMLAMSRTCVPLLLAAGTLARLDEAITAALSGVCDYAGQFTIAWAIVAVCAIAGGTHSAQCNELAWGALSRFDAAWTQFKLRKKRSIGKEIIAAFRETLERRLHAQGNARIIHPLANKHTMHVLRCFVTHGEAQTTHEVIEFCRVAGCTPPGFTQ